MYYSIPVFSVMQLTADYRFVNNPAYNRGERDPVSVLGLRAHIAS
ncbi:MAG: hypothetical protein JO032_12895 [Alphaproteobacteria bacterium]|nr:hypothetical protein [Alphaproteobacteria bacterium]